jgi:hypothetical protein
LQRRKIPSLQILLSLSLMAEDHPGSISAVSAGLFSAVKETSSAENVEGESSGEKQRTAYPENRGSDCSGR